MVRVSHNSGGNGLLDDGLSLDSNWVWDIVRGINMDGGWDLDDPLGVKGASKGASTLRSTKTGSWTLWISVWVLTMGALTVWDPLRTVGTAMGRWGGAGGRWSLQLPGLRWCKGQGQRGRHMLLGHGGQRHRRCNAQLRRQLRQQEGLRHNQDHELQQEELRHNQDRELQQVQVQHSQGVPQQWPHQRERRKRIPKQR